MVKNALISTAVLALVATFGDWVWANYLSRHLMIAGLVHGGVMCLAMGAVIGLPVGRVALGAGAGLAIGVLSAGCFYLLAPMLRYGAMFPAWFVLWVMLAVLYQRLAGAGPLRLAIARGVIAGIASGLAFFLISGMWTGWNPETINYLEHFGRWLFAFAPGFLVLQGGRVMREDRQASDII
jgi:hypothetical protein